VTCNGATAIFSPTSALTVSTLYTGTLTTGMKNVGGLALAANKQWTFTTGTTPDSVAPTAASTDPADTATGVSLNRSATSTFSEALDPETCTTTTFTLQQGGTPVTGTVLCIGATAQFKPTSNLAASTLYTATITTGVKDLAGNALAANKVWSFTTGSSVAVGPAPVVLGTAGNFAILSKSGISTVPASSITGNIGVSPIDRTAVTGFSETMDASNVFATSGQTGTYKIYAADYTPPTPSNMTTAISDMEIAYTDAAGRSTPDFVEHGAGEIGGLTLAPGLYKWGTGLAISTSVTLSGSANDVWIFQVAGNLTQASGTIITLVGALPKNIFWQVGGSTTILSTATFKGILLTKTAISMGTGTSVTGRLFSQTAVTLNQTTVTEPAP
jgi:hypothetical protein